MNRGWQGKKKRFGGREGGKAHHNNKVKSWSNFLNLPRSVGRLVGYVSLSLSPETERIALFIRRNFLGVEDEPWMTMRLSVHPSVTKGIAGGGGGRSRRPGWIRAKEKEEEAPFTWYISPSIPLTDYWDFASGIWIECGWMNGWSEI